jgi:hypothetical protein
MTQKWNLQDIRPVEPRAPKRSLPATDMRGPRPTHAPTEDINIRRPHTPVAPREAEEVFDTDEDTAVERIPISDGRKKDRNRVVIGVIIFVLVVGAGLVISSLTSGAEVVVYPKVRDINVNAEFTAYPEARAGELAYEVMTLEATGERQVKASGQEEVTVQATGEIEIVKTTPGAERLIKNTRFATAEGLVFRIQESVVVPGSVKGTDGKEVPGRIRAAVFADEAGEKYNIKANTRLTIPGFKESGLTELFNAMYAENPEAFVNGFAGPQFKIDENELSTARQALQLELRDALRARSQTERPAGFTTFDDAIAFTYTALPPVKYGDDLVTIREQATLQQPLFNDEDFASYVAKETIVGYEGDPVRLDAVTDLRFAFSSATTSQNNLANLTSLTFKLVGDPTVVWTYDVGKLKVDLLGVERTAITGIMTQYPGIERSEVSVRPAWSRSMPDEIDKIKVSEVLKSAE